MNNLDYKTEILLKKLAITRDITFPKIEGKLYRYRPANQYAFDEIQNSQIYVTDPENYNDPFDSTYGQSDEDLINKQYKADFWIEIANIQGYWDDMSLNKVIEEKESMTVHEYCKLISNYSRKSDGNLLEEIIKTLRSVDRKPRNTQFKVACFSETKDSLPMWAYYADNHNGICLEYDFSKIESEENCDLRDDIYKIHYSHNRPKDRHGIYSPFIKAYEWAHESEWRLVSFDESDYVFVPCLSAVYLGSKIKLSEVKKIQRIIRNIENKIELYHAWEDPEKYRLNFIKMNS